jgi:hypothetical protein
LIRASLKREPDDNKTWANLLPVLEEAGVLPEFCFFTNFYMGLIPGNKSTGKFPGRHDLQFTEHCLNILVKQLDVQCPRLVLVLGGEFYHLLARISDDLSRWKKGMKFTEIDAVGPVISGAAINGIPGFTTNFALLIHPCKRKLNVGGRNYKGRRGDAAEKQMIRDGLVRSTTT